MKLTPNRLIYILLIITHEFYHVFSKNGKKKFNKRVITKPQKNLRGVLAWLKRLLTKTETTMLKKTFYKQILFWLLVIIGTSVSCSKSFDNGANKVNANQSATAKSNSSSKPKKKAVFNVEKTVESGKLNSK